MLPWALILSRCGASGPVLRAAAACLVAPEGVAVWAVAVPLPSWWPPRGSPFQRWRAVACSLAPEGVAGRALAWGQGPVRWRLVLRRAPWLHLVAPVVLRRAPVVPRFATWCLPWLRWSLRRASGGAAVGADASKPRAGPLRRAPEGGWVVGPVGRFAAPPRGVGSSVLGGPSVALPRKCGVGPGGGARLAVSPLRRGAALPTASVCPLPEGSGLTSAPSGAWSVGGKPLRGRCAAGLRPSEEGRARASRG
jgi:hypothetical protein